MIAKNLKAGSYAAGLIEYTFSGKEEGRRAEEKKAELHIASGDLFLPKSYSDKVGIDRLHRAFNDRTHEYLKQNPDNKTKLIGHQVLSFTDKDLQKLKGEGVRKVLEEYLELSGIDKTQFYSVGHNDTRNYHIHIVYHKIRDDGKQMDQWKENVKTTERGVALALKHKLEMVGEMQRFTQAKGVLQIRVGHEDIKELAKSSPELSQARNMHHFKKLMEASGKTIEPVKMGERFKFDGKTVSNADLSAVFFHNRHQEPTAFVKQGARFEGFTRVGPAESRKGAKENSVVDDGDKALLPPPRKFGESLIPKMVSEDKHAPFKNKKRKTGKKKQKSTTQNI